MTDLKEFDKPYIESISAVFNQLGTVYQCILKNYSFNLESNEISDAIIERLKTYYLTQVNIKSFLAKRYVTAASDFFVESVLFFLKVYLESTHSKLEAHSERQIIRERKAIRPDISIWDGDTVTAIIECKTQLGWNRFDWEQNFIDRETKLQQEYPEAKSFLLVLTSSNWSGFGENSALNKKYFILLDTWPTNYKGKDQILTPIENLFKQL